MKSKHSENCPFCNISKNRILFENEKAFAIFDQYPVSPGHTLIISKSHYVNYFELPKSEQVLCWNLVNTIKENIEEVYSPDGYNIGININESAGQTINHVHIHIIPRYKGDEINPEGGVRGVIPGKKSY